MRPVRTSRSTAACTCIDDVHGVRRINVSGKLAWPLYAGQPDLMRIPRRGSRAARCDLTIGVVAFRRTTHVVSHGARQASPTTGRCAVAPRAERVARPASVGVPRTEGDGDPECRQHQDNRHGSDQCQRPHRRNTSVMQSPGWRPCNRVHVGTGEQSRGHVRGNLAGLYRRASGNRQHQEHYCSDRRRTANSETHVTLPGRASRPGSGSVVLGPDRRLYAGEQTGRTRHARERRRVERQDAPIVRFRNRDVRSSPRFCPIPS